MCGICGIVTKQETRSSACRAMMQAMAHRGYEGDACWDDPTIGISLGHRRLAIIDLSDAGLQPMHSRSGRYTIVFNGEIYNFRELSVVLAAEGVTFSSSSDTELLLAVMEQWGAEGLCKLRGMFAFVMVDHHAKLLICARDPFGIKPLYYYLSPDCRTFIFASEIKGLLASGMVPRKADPAAIAAYHRFYCVPQPHTIINGVLAVPPAHYATVTLVGDVLEIALRRYVDLTTVDSCPKNYLPAVREALFDAVRAHLVSDVPVGLFLSGGIDSATLGGIMRRLHPAAHFHTFSIGFADKSPLDESPIAALVAKKLGTIHHHCVIGSDDFRRELFNFIDAIDQPSGDGLNSYFVARFASDWTKVAFSGLGGDELFLGYRYMQELRRLFAWQQSSIGLSMARVLALLKRYPRLLHHAGLNFLRHMNLADHEIYGAVRSLRPISTPHQFDVMLSSSDRLNNFSRAELLFYLPNMLLRDADATSMYSTLEVRVPFLDLPLTRLMLSLASGYKPARKQLLLDAVGDLLPSEIMRLPKRGFEMPVGFWIKETLHNQLEQLTVVPGLSATQRKNELVAFRQDPRHYLPVWSSILLNLWLARYHIEVVQE